MGSNKTRGFLYQLVKRMGDVNAAKKGKIGKRVVRRMVGNAIFRGGGRFFR